MSRRALAALAKGRPAGELKPANFYQASVAWNAFREGKTITSVKYDTKKGLYTVSA
jgi:hypothetical protein